jgi:hypothetical protein
MKRFDGEAVRRTDARPGGAPTARRVAADGPRLSA